MTRARSFALLLAIVGCGGELPCGDGTQEVDGLCVSDAYIPVSVGDVTAANFPEKAALSECQFMRACDPVAWTVDPADIGFEPGSNEAERTCPQGDMDTCVAAWTEYYAEQQGVFEDRGCDFIPAQATACLNTGTCADYAANYDMFNDAQTGACYEMWDCS
jgi:hypothetical protein